MGLAAGLCGISRWILGADDRFRHRCSQERETQNEALLSAVRYWSSIGLAFLLTVAFLVVNSNL